MQPRLQTLKRLVTLYGVVEEMHSAELQRMTAAVREAQQAIGVQQQVERSARFDGRDALMTTDRMGWEIAQTQGKSAGWKRRRLEKVRSERELLSDAARAQYVASRLKSEQMKRLVEGVAVRAEIEEGRRVQAGSDDRFLARRRWSDSQGRIREGQQIKVS
jgi:hypothetical protein